MSLPYLLAFIAIFGIAMYFLYNQGFAVSKCIAAILFVFQPGNSNDRARINSCTGWVRHRCRIRESRIYTFSFACELSNGDVEVTLTDMDKRLLLRLNRWYPAGSIALDGNSRYYLHWEFKSASGWCELYWQ